MRKIDVTLLEPDYYKDFHCVASTCRNNCCVRPWMVYVDKSYYKKLRALREPKWLTDSFGEHFIRDHDSDAPERYAYIARNDDGCKFQDAKGLCLIHSELGEQYLCHTCQIYPRITNDIRGAFCFEKGLSISCEEVVRLLLDKHDSIFFQDTIQTMTTAQIENVIVEGRVHKSERTIVEHYHLIRSVAIAILQNRDYDFDKRMILLMIFFDRMQQAEQQGRVSELQQIIDIFVDAVDERLFDKMLEAKVELRALPFGNRAFLTAFNNPMDYGDTLAIFCNQNIAKEDYPVQRKRFDNYMADKQYFLENLFVSELFTRRTPFYEEYSIWECAQTFVACYLIYRYMVGVYLSGNNTPSDTEIIDLTANFGKAVLHNRGVTINNMELFKVNELDNLANIITILKG